MSPILVFAVTLAVPFSSRPTSDVRVTPENSCSNAALLRDVRGIFWKDMSKSTRLPVETPPATGTFGRTS